MRIVPKWAENLSAEERQILFAPSPHLLRFRAFAAEYRKNKPAASMNEVQHAYQMSDGGDA